MEGLNKSVCSKNWSSHNLFLHSAPALREFCPFLNHATKAFACLRSGQLYQSYSLVHVHRHIYSYFLGKIFVLATLEIHIIAISQTKEKRVFLCHLA